MTYTFKLARRIAVSRAWLFSPVLLVLATACGTPTVSEGFTPPDATDVVAITVSPKLDTIRTSESLQLHVQALDAQGDTVAPDVDWFASGGTVSPSGTFSSSSTGRFTLLARHRKKQQVFDTATVVVIPALATVIAVVVSPASLTLTPGSSAILSASAQMSDGGSSPVSVTWSATGGTISGSGGYTAGGTPGLYRIIATEVGGTHADTVPVTISASTLWAIFIAPGTASLAAGAAQQFTASGQLSDGSPSSVTVNWSATGGSITPGGLYTAGTTAGNYRVIATQAGGTLADTALVGIAVPAPTLQQVILTPPTVSLLTGATQQFATSGLMSDGSSKSVSVTFTATGGSITAAGAYTAGATAGTYRVIATQSGGTLADTSVVTVTAPTLQQIVLTPATLTIQSGTIQQFSASGRLSDGSVSSVNVTFGATGGTISSGGLYTAGSTAGTFRVIATQSGGTLADTSSVTITAATLTQVILLPATASVARGGTQQFAVSGILSNGSTTTPAVTYSATGGTITTGGLYTAGNTTGTFRVIAVQQGGTLADTSVVTITTPPVLQAVLLTPATASVVVGGTQQFTVSGQWSNGATTAPAVTYTATGGTITAGGLYSAGNTTGSFRVIATQQGGTLADTTSVLVTVAPVTDEPVYTPGISTLVGLDSFDTYTLPVSGSPAEGGPSTNHSIFPTTTRAWVHTEYGIPTDPAVYVSASVETDPAQCHNGVGRCLRSNGTPGTEGIANAVSWIWGPDGGVIPPKRAKHVFQFWYKVTAGNGSSIDKWFEVWGDQEQPSGDVRIQLGGNPNWSPNCTQGHIWDWRGTSDQPPLGQTKMGTYDGNWHRYTLAYQTPTTGGSGPSSPSSRDGYMRLWIDGAKVVDISQAMVGVTPPGGSHPWTNQNQVDAMNSLRLRWFMGWPTHVNVAANNWSMWVDDFRWWTEP